MNWVTVTRKPFVMNSRKFMENASLAVGSVAIDGFRVIGIAAEMGGAIHGTVQLSSLVTSLQTFFNWFTGIFYVIYYALYSYRTLEGLVNLGKGGDLREELLKASDPIKALEKKVESEILQLRRLTISEREAIAVEEGALWLEKVVKEVEKQGKEVDWDPSDPEFVRRFLSANPEYMQSKMGVLPEFMQRFGTHELARFGMWMAEERLLAKLEVGYSRLLGADAIAAFKAKDGEKFKELLVSPSWQNGVIKLGLCLIGLVAMIAGMVLTGGVALGVILTLYGISALVWIATGDAQAFKAQWESGEFKKRDKWILITSVVLSVVAVGSLIAMSVLSGGAPIYLCSLILVAAWLVTNGRALYCLYQREVRPWEYAAVITPEHFRKLTQTEASEEQIEQVLNQMEPIHQKGIRERFTNWKKAALNWEEEMKRRQEVGFARLLERIEQARSVALRSVA